ncbi:MAG: hypothetical protein ABSG25_08780 [Bryobacteraceae bacterium]
MPITSDLFKKYFNEILIETGSFEGHGIQAALDAGFKTVYSIELSERFYNFCKNKFKDNPYVNLVFGDSSIMLKEVLKNINSKCTIFLDGHFSGGETSKGLKNSPLIEELEAIKQHIIKNHIILIDDLRDWIISPDCDFNVDILKQKILEINPKYKFIIEDSPNFKQDILVGVVDE